MTKAHVKKVYDDAVKQAEKEEKARKSSTGKKWDVSYCVKMHLGVI